MSIVTSFASTIINPEPTKAKLEVEGDKTYSLQFNPANLTLRRGRSWQKGREFESGQPSLTFTGGEPDTLNFDVTLDQTEPRAANTLEKLALAAAALNPLFLGGVLGPSNDRDIVDESTELGATNDVADHLRAWFKMTEVLDISGSGGTTDAYRRPPIVVMRWGSFTFSGAIRSLDVTVTLFDGDGNPRRASVRVAMIGRALADLTPDEVMFPDRPSESGGGGAGGDDSR